MLGIAVIGSALIRRVVLRSNFHLQSGKIHELFVVVLLLSVPVLIMRLLLTLFFIAGVRGLLHIYIFLGLRCWASTLVWIVIDIALVC
jgi:hypothetical protein